MTEQIIINKTENPDSIEWRLETGKSVKVYGDISDYYTFKTKLENAIKLLKEVDSQ